MDRRDFLKAGGAAALWPGLMVLRARAGQSEDTDRLDIRSDPRIEIYGVVLYLGPFRGLKDEDGVIRSRVVTPYEFAYKREVDARFGRFKDHPAVKICGEMAEEGLFRLGHPPSVMLHLSDPPGLETKIPIDDFLIRMAGGREPLDAFLAAMRAFSRDSDFMTFFQDHGGFYKRLAAEYRKAMEWNYVRDLEEYYGARQDAYHLTLATLSHPGGFGPRIRTPEGRYEAYAVIGPKGVKDDIPEFGSGDAMRRLCWHEFSHPFVNPMTEARVGDLRESLGVLESRKLPAPVVERIRAAGMWDVHLCDQAGEYLVRGVTTRLAFRKMGAESGRAAMAEEIRQGFVHLEAICGRLEAYESRRDRYPALKDYYDEIVAAFRDLAR
jgi:hypothetical protein